MRRLFFVFSFATATATAAAFAACSSSSDDAAPSPGVEAGADTAPAPDASTDDAPDAAPSDPRCTALEAALQAGAESVRKKQAVQHLTVGTLTPECGKTVVFADAPNTPNPVKPNDLWRIGSVTKTYAAATVVSLAREGKLSLDDKLSKWVPDFPNGDAITIRQVLNHSSGIFNYTESKTFQSDLVANSKRKFTPAELVAYATAEQPYFPPGQGWTYSNTDYVLAGMIIEKATGDTAIKAIHAQAFAKAGLTHTFLDGAEPLGGDLVHGFQRGTDVTTLADPSVAWTAGAMTATPADVLDWAAALYGSTKVLSEADLMTMENGVDAGGIGYGLGVEVLPAKITDGNGVAYGHNGSIFGFMTTMAYFPAKKRAFVAIVADTEGEPNDLAIVALTAFEKL